MAAKGVYSLPRNGVTIFIIIYNYGPKLPRSPLDIHLVNLFLSDLQKPISRNGSEWKYVRLKGLKKFRHNDIMVFKKDFTDEEYLVKRCVGLSGDTFQIENGEILINGVILTGAPTIKRRYRLRFNMNSGFPKYADSLNLKYNVIEELFNCIWAEVSMSKENANFIRDHHLADSVSYIINNQQCYSSYGSPIWTLDNLSPLIIPYKGFTIPVNERTMNLYSNVIIRDERMNLSRNNGVYFINNTQVNQYTFKKNYYFMVGDNRNDSYDSRYWGFACEENIEGKVICSFSANINRLLSFKIF